MRILRTALVALVAAGCAHRSAPAAAVGGAAVPADVVTLVFVGTTDIHGHIDGDSVDLAVAGSHVKTRRGGLPLLGGYVATLRRQHPGRVVLVDSGDMLQGTLVSNLGEGRSVVKAMNALGYAAAAVGNHEFDFGPSGPHQIPKDPGEDPVGALHDRAGEARYPWLTSNITDGAGRPPGAPAVREFTIVDVDGVKVGLVGGTSEDTRGSTRTPNLVGLHIAPLAESIPRAAAAARAAGATVIIALIHEGGECTRFDAPDDLASCRGDSELFKLARALPPGAVDAIFGGHTHQGVAHRVAGVPLLQAFAEGRSFSRLDVDVNRATGKVVGAPRIHQPQEICEVVADGNGSCDPRRARGGAIVPARYEGEPVVRDEAVAASFADDLARAATEQAALVGVTLEKPIAARYRDPSALGNLVADALRRAAGAEVGLTNGGGLRADLPAGPLTRGAVFEALPFDNRLATFKLRGSSLLQMLTRNLAGKHGILSVSNLTARAECKGGKLVLAEVRVGGEPLVADRLYTVGTLDFLAQGGDDFGGAREGLVDVRIDEGGPMVRDIVAAELLRYAPRLAPEGTPIAGGPPRLALPGPRPIDCPAR